MSTRFVLPLMRGSSELRSVCFVLALAGLPSLVACGSAGADAASSPTSASSGEPSKATTEPADPTASTDATPTTTATLGAPYPIVLMHGMAGFTELKNLPIVYYNGVIADLGKIGEVEVFATLAPAYDTSLERAKAVAPQIDAILKQTGRAKVNVIAHSQGGMDARVLASPAGLGYGDRIASLTTIATPHHGSKVADLALGLLKNVPDSTVDTVTSALLGLLQKSVYQLDNDPHLRAQIIELSEDHMAKVFNPTFVDDPRVRYGSYGGRTNLQNGVLACAGARFPDDPTKLDTAQPFIEPTAIFLEEGARKANDGLVTVASSRWGAFQQCVPADHMKEVGQLDSSPDVVSKFDHLAFFRSVVARLRSDGF